MLGVRSGGHEEISTLLLQGWHLQEKEWAQKNDSKRKICNAPDWESGAKASFGEKLRLWNLEWEEYGAAKISEENRIVLYQASKYCNEFCKFLQIQFKNSLRPGTA